MSLTDALAELLALHGLQARHGGLWHKAWFKARYYGCYNRVFDALAELEEPFPDGPDMSESVAVVVREIGRKCLGC